VNGDRRPDKHPDGHALRNEEPERTGHGLVGIRERVSLYGGVLRIGPRPEGGFEVCARFPLTTDPPGER